jgi:molybdopterin synthase sulfur carrier subunit
MKLRCYAYFREILGKNELEWTAPAATLGVLLGDLSRQYGKPFRRWVYEGEALSHIVIILVNGKDVRDLQGLDTPLKPDDTIVLFPPLAGG